MTQQSLPLAGRHGIPLEIERDQPDPARVADRLASAKALCDHFRLAKLHNL